MDRYSAEEFLEAVTLLGCDAMAGEQDTITIVRIDVFREENSDAVEFLNMLRAADTELNDEVWRILKGRPDRGKLRRH